MDGTLENTNTESGAGETHPAQLTRNRDYRGETKPPYISYLATNKKVVKRDLLLRRKCAELVISVINEHGGCCDINTLYDAFSDEDKRCLREYFTAAVTELCRQGYRQHPPELRPVIQGGQRHYVLNQMQQPEQPLFKNGLPCIPVYERC